MNMHRKLLAEYLQNLAYFSALYGVFIIPAYAILQSTGDMVALLALAVPFFLLVPIRLHVNNIFLFLLLHLLILVFVVIVPGSIIGSPENHIFFRLALLAFMLASSILSLYRRLRGKALGLTAFDFAQVVFITSMFIILTLIANYFEFRDITFLFPILAVTVIGCYILRTHIINIDYALDLITTTTTQPIKSILSFNNFMITGLLLVTFVTALVSRYLWISNLITAFGSLLHSFLRFLFSFLPTAPDEYIPETSPDLFGNDAMNEYLHSLSAGAKQPSALFLLIEQIFLYVVFTAFVLIVISSMIYMLFLIYKRFYLNSSETLDEKEFILSEITTDKASSLADMIDRLFSGKNAPKDRTRRVFYRRVRRLIAKGMPVAVSDTPREIAGTAREMEDIDNLTTAYEKVRYGEK